MKLLIISHTPHYKRDNAYVGWGPTVREIDSLANIFERIIHVAPLHSGSVPQSALPYRSLKVRFHPVHPAGGNRLIDKIGVVAYAHSYIRAIMLELRNADVVHVRCPSNISLIGIILLIFLRSPTKRWIKYAGNWQPGEQESASYKLQRYILRRRLHRGIVTINGEWPRQPKHIHTFLNPCLTDQELADARVVSAGKLLTYPLRLLYVGHLAKTKGAERALIILSRLHQEGIISTLDLVGDGVERPDFENLAGSLRITPFIKFHGWLPRTALAPLYNQSHIMIFPTSSEGWPKVLSEAMAYGVVPVTSNVSSIPQYLRKFRVGRVYSPDNVEAYVKAISEYWARPDMWREESERGKDAALLFSYSNYLLKVSELLGLKRSEKDCPLSMSI